MKRYTNFTAFQVFCVTNKLPLSKKSLKIWQDFKEMKDEAFSK